LVWHEEEAGLGRVGNDVLAGAQHAWDDELSCVLLVPSLVEALAFWSLGYGVDVNAERLRCRWGGASAEVVMRGGAAREDGASLGEEDRQHGEAWLLPFSRHITASQAVAPGLHPVHPYIEFIIGNEFFEELRKARDFGGLEMRLRFLNPWEREAPLHGFVA